MSDNKGLENTKYKLIKNEDKLILTDKKTLKSRVLDVEDIDYVVDDNQRLRDQNIIENYFRLKDEPYEPVMMTKTADYVKEQKEAEKLYSDKKYEDLIDEFIRKYSMTKNEIQKMSLIPDESTIRNFISRTNDDKKAMINDFKILKKKLTEDKNLGTDVFTYLRTYFRNYQYNIDLINLYENTNIKDYLKKKVFYQDEDEYEKVKNLDKLESLQDLVDHHIDYFGGIKLGLLQKLVEKYNRIKEIYYSNSQGKQKFCQLDNNPPNFARVVFLAYNLNLIPYMKDDIQDKKDGKGIGGGEIDDLIEAYNNLNDTNREIFDDWMDTTDFNEFQKRIKTYKLDLKKKKINKISKFLRMLINGITSQEIFNEFKKKRHDSNNSELVQEDEEEEIEDEEENEKIEEDKKEELPTPIIPLGDPKLDPNKPPNEMIQTREFTSDTTTKPEMKKQPENKVSKTTEEDKKEKSEKLIKENKDFIHSSDTTEIEDIFNTKIPTDKIKAYLSIENKIMSTLLKRINLLERVGNTTAYELIENITKEKGLKYFNTTVKIQILIDLINLAHTPDEPYKITGYFWVVNKTQTINFAQKAQIFESGNRQNIKPTKIYSNYSNSEQYIKDFISNVVVNVLEVVIRSVDVGGNCLKTFSSAGWTDDTLTRIEKIKDILNRSSGIDLRYNTGRINPSLLRVMNRNKSFGLEGTGWTDNTLTRIDTINNTLSKYI